MAAPAAGHGQLMDSVYRGQRHIYDATRKYFLFGRDRLIGALGLPPGGSVLEIACGTGRNLDLIARRWPGAGLHGLDISAEMLKSAAAKLGAGAVLAQGDATRFDAQALLGKAQFDRVILSFATSMIPDWQSALTQAAACVAPGGSLHIVDFGDLARMPGPLRTVLQRWLAHFHVTPRHDLIDEVQRLATRLGANAGIRRGPGNYYALIELRDDPLSLRSIPAHSNRTAAAAGDDGA